MPSNEELLVEYQEAHNMIRHYDEQKWQIGAILIAGCLVAMAVVVTNLHTIAVFSLIIIAIWSITIILIWIGWYMRNSDIIYILFTRTEEIEEILGFKMERCIRDKHPHYTKERKYDVCDQKKTCKELHPFSGRTLSWILLFVLTLAWIGIIILRFTIK